jgi:hypothetical protein|tara:strand:+ start:238 stop:411 length:174 start_codon:yes stop_codon:yes gene_type:complete
MTNSISPKDEKNYSLWKAYGDENKEIFLKEMEKLNKRLTRIEDKLDKLLDREDGCQI